MTAAGVEEEDVTDMTIAVMTAVGEVTATTIAVEAVTVTMTGGVTTTEAATDLSDSSGTDVSAMLEAKLAMIKVGVTKLSMEKSSFAVSCNQL